MKDLDEKLKRQSCTNSKSNAYFLARSIRSAPGLQVVYF